LRKKTLVLRITTGGEVVARKKPSSLECVGKKGKDSAVGKKKKDSFLLFAERLPLAICKEGDKGDVSKRGGREISAKWIRKRDSIAENRDRLIGENDLQGDDPYAKRTDQCQEPYWERKRERAASACRYNAGKK